MSHAMEDIPYGLRDRLERSSELNELLIWFLTFWFTSVITSYWERLKQIQNSIRSSKTVF
jgi:hypothetical protein